MTEDKEKRIPVCPICKVEMEIRMSTHRGQSHLILKCSNYECMPFVMLSGVGDEGKDELTDRWFRSFKEDAK